MGRIDVLEMTLKKHHSKLPDSPEGKYHLHRGGNLESRIIVIVVCIFSELLISVMSQGLVCVSANFS